jgi:phosphoglycolate phosphatase-like HAD superfamily hydrolase
MVRLVLFDIDGTLIRTGGAGVKAFAKVFETEFKAVDGFERMKFGGRTDTGLVREFFGYHNIPATPENFRRFFERYVFWLDYILKQNETTVCAGVWDFIRELQGLAKAPLIGLLTGNIRLGAEIKLRHAGLWDVFVTGGFADDNEERDKIAAIAKERGSRLLNEELQGEQIVVIGDTPLDIRCARAIGAKVLAVATGMVPIEELASHKPEWAVKDLTEVKAGEIVETLKR